MSHEIIKTIAVIDLETNGLPLNNTCAITELSIYAFAAKCFENSENNSCSMLKPNEGMEGVGDLNKGPPELPRVLHKLTMMINPIDKIHPISANISGLTNDMLDCESPFDENTANCLLSFLQRLEKPVCLIAHNGWKFDFPIVRYVMSQINMSIPSSIFCVDSFPALRELDEKKLSIEMITTILDNEMPPLLALDEYRRLFTDSFQPKQRFPKKGTYVLGNIYERLFQQPPGKMHCAENDVAILTKILLSYGLPFRAYIEERKKSFKKVPKLGKTK